MSDSKLTIGEFKRWLEGVEEMQGNEWSPSPEQWKKIRAKFDQVDNLPVYDIVKKAVDDASRLALGFVPSGNNMTQPIRLPAPGSSSLDSAVPITLPAASDRVPVRTTMPPVLLTPKTPDIDTSGGNYNSPFSG